MQELETYLVETETGFEINPEALEELKRLKKESDKYAKDYKALSTKITNELKTHFTATTKVSGYNFIVKGGTYEFEFDLETFKQEHLDLFIKYVKPTFKAISYQLATATREKKDVQ